MNTSSYRNLGVGFTDVAHRILRLGWPAVLSCVLILAAGACLAGAWFANHQGHEVKRAIVVLQRTQKATPARQTTSNDPLPAAPQDSQYLGDLKAILTLAKTSGISLGVVEYKTEHNEKLPLTLRTIELKIREDYPKVKAFLSQVLTDFPYGSLQEIRVERADGLAAQGTLLIRLMLVYKTAGSGPDKAVMPAITAK